MASFAFAAPTNISSEGYEYTITRGNEESSSECLMLDFGTGRCEFFIGNNPDDVENKEGDCEVKAATSITLTSGDGVAKVFKLW